MKGIQKNDQIFISHGHIMSSTNGIGALTLESSVAQLDLNRSELLALKAQGIINIQGLLNINWRKYATEIGIGIKKVEFLKAIVATLYKQFEVQIGTSAATQRDVDSFLSDVIEESHFTFSCPVQELDHTKPVLLLINGREYAVHAWKSLICFVASYIYENFPERILVLVGMSYSKATKRICLKKNNHNFIHGEKIADRLWVETNFSAKDCLRIACELAQICKLNCDNIVVYYNPVGRNARPASQKEDEKKSIMSPSPLVDVPPTSFEKGLDWSTLTMGITVPVKSHKAFSNNLSPSSFVPGSSIDILIHCKEKTFSASIIKTLSLRNPKRSPVVQIIWSRKSPIALMLQTTFVAEYTQLEKQHSNRDGIRDILTISCGKRQNEFIINFDATMIEASSERNEQPVEEAQPSTNEPCEYLAEFKEFTEQCKPLLEESFPCGFRLDSTLECKRFHDFWKHRYGMQKEVSDNDIQQALRVIGVEFEKRIYAPSRLASETVFEDLNNYVEHLFESGIPFIYYQALFDEFTRRNTDWKINSPEMLKSFLKTGKCKRSLRRSCIAIDNDIDISPTSEIREYLRAQSRSVNYAQMQTALPHISLDVIKHELVTHSEFINSGRGEYIHADIVDLTDTDLQCISKIIQFKIRHKGYITGTELWESIETEYPECIDRYSHLPLVGFRDALKYKINSVFSFQGNIISNVDDPIRMSDVFAEFCLKRNNFALADLEELCKDTGSPIYFEPVYENSLRVSQEHFVSPSSADFDIAKVDETIGLFCRNDFISISEVTSFATFPNAGYPWTNYLLESFVAKYSKLFQLLHNSFNAKVCVGAIVKRTCGLLDYNELLARVIAKSNCEMVPESALDYLCTTGFLGRHRYTKINIVLSEARRIRSKKR